MYQGFIHPNFPMVPAYKPPRYSDDELDMNFLLRLVRRFPAAIYDNAKGWQVMGNYGFDYPYRPLFDPLTLTVRPPRQPARPLAPQFHILHRRQIDDHGPTMAEIFSQLTDTENNDEARRFTRLRRRHSGKDKITGKDRVRIVALSVRRVPDGDKLLRREKWKAVNRDLFDIYRVQALVPRRFNGVPNEARAYESWRRLNYPIPGPIPGPVSAGPSL